MSSFSPKTVIANALTQAEATARVSEIDLSCIMDRLCEPMKNGGKGFSREAACFVEREYREFLILCALYPEESLVPAKTINEIWHTHILHTTRYEADCMHVFGYFLHHLPYYCPCVGDAGFAENYRKTRELYLTHFGHDLTEPPAMYGWVLA